jgi:DNA-directed RNA polymerase specialized sigma24 family protein
MSETHYRLVLNFFYFLLLDEAMAISAAFKAVQKIQKRIKNKPSDESYSALLDKSIIKTITEVYTLYRTRKQNIQLAPPKSDWSVSRPEYLIAWKEFMRRADPLFSEVLILHYILGYTPQLIADSLGMPVGTVTFRLGRGLESLGDSSVIKSLVSR